MSPEEHYRRAEEMLAEAEASASSHHRASTLTAQAAVHAQLAALGTPLAWQVPR